MGDISASISTMALIVQKYGGTSVGSVERVQSVAQRIHRTVQQGNTVVVVVSAMGKTTDTLVNLAQEITANPSRREMDMLLSTGEQVTIALMTMALQEIGQPAISLTGAQVGIVTEAEYSRARILSIKPDRIKRHLDQAQVVVVAGFQGVSSRENLEITTLGRGGSDTSAVALAAALKANFCEIYTDVPGILTTDPRLVPSARLMEEITCDEMLELASLGAKVLHPRAVEIAHQQVDVDLIIQSIHEGNSNDIAFTVVKNILSKAEAVTEAIAPALRSTPSNPTEAEVMIETGVAKISIAGAGMIGRPGIAAKMFKTLAEANINIEMISTSEVKVSCVVAKEDGDRGIKVLCEAFDVQLSPNPVTSQTVALAPPVRGVALDMKQAQIAIRHVQDKPGMAASIFGVLAENNISVDTIIQSQRCRILAGKPTRDIAFTVAQVDVEAACRALNNLSDGFDQVVIDEDIAKVSVVGAGMIGQPGV